MDILLKINSTHLKTILITGGAGFIGSNLSRKLIDKGFKVIVLDNLSKQIHGDNPDITSPIFKNLPKEVQFVNGDITSRTDLEKVIIEMNCDAIVHYAAETGTGQSMYEIEKYNQVNIGGTALMLDILTNQKHQVKKVVVASSRSIYGEGKYISKHYGVVYPSSRNEMDMNEGYFEATYNGNRDLELLPTDEESKIHPSSVYGITKQVQEQLVMTVCPTIGIAPVALRYQNVYGPGQSLSNPYTGILSIFSNLILSGNPINIFEDGNESRDFVFIDDVVEATFLSLQMDVANGNIFNVGTGIATKVIEVVEQLMKCYNKKVSYTVTGNYRVGDIRHNYADLTKIKSMIGFNPKVNFEMGITQFAAWVMHQHLPADKYEESLNEMKAKGLFKG